MCRARIGGTEIYRRGGQKFIGGQKWTSTFTPAYTYVVARIRVMVWANVMVEVCVSIPAIALYYLFLLHF